MSVQLATVRASLILSHSARQARHGWLARTQQKRNTSTPDRDFRNLFEPTKNGRTIWRGRTAMKLPWKLPCLAVLARAVMALAAVLIAGGAMAQPSYPEKPIRVLAGFPA